MASGRAAKPATPAGPPTSPKFLFRTTRQIIWFSFFALFFALTAAELGLVSQQIHKYGNEDSSWPNGQDKRVFGLLLFTTLFSLLFSLAHWTLSLGIHTVVLFILGVFYGVAAGLLYGTPFGHGWRKQCSNPVNTFPTSYQAYVGECSRWMAAAGIAWALFALATLGFFATLVDRFEFHTKRSQMYDLEAHTDEEKAAINRLPSRSESNAASH